MFLYICSYEMNWMPELTDHVVVVKDVGSIDSFLNANPNIDEFEYLILDISVLISEDGELDRFFFREYDRKPRLIIFNQLGIQLDGFTDKGIIIIRSQDECKDYFDSLGLLKKEEVKAVERDAAIGLEQHEAVITEPELPPQKPEEPVQITKEKKPAVTKAEKKKKAEKPQIELPKLVMPSLPKLPKRPAPSNAVGEAILSGRQEIGFIGALRGVGTTFAAFYYAKQCAAEKQNVSLVLRDPIEAKVLADLDKYVDVFEMEDLRSALKNDIVVYDFGVMDRADMQLIRDFERCNKRYVVACMSPFKKHGLNNVLQYVNETTLDFTVLFNFTAEEEVKALQKTFKGTLVCDNLEFVDNI